MASPSAGRFVWHELVTSDALLATKFYSGLFGWSTQENPMPGGGTYRMFSQGDTMVGGAMAAPAGVPSGWLVYLGVEDVDGSAKKVAELGGTIMVPPTTVPDMLRFACGADPTGAAFGLLQPFGPDRPPYEGADRPGTFCWDELHTRDLPAAKAFFMSLFGWTGKGDEGGMDYWHWRNGGKDIGGMTSHMGGPNVPPHWLSYIAVSDVDGTSKQAATLGGKVLVPAMDIPKVGRFSVVQDPTGAVFSPFRSARV